MPTNNTEHRPRRDRRRCHICTRPLVTADEIARGVCNTCHDSAFPESDDLLLL